MGPPVQLNSASCFVIVGAFDLGGVCNMFKLVGGGEEVNPTRRATACIGRMLVTQQSNQEPDSSRLMRVPFNGIGLMGVLTNVVNIYIGNTLLQLQPEVLMRCLGDVWVL